MAQSVPDAGDILWVNFDPPVGREQSGRRPAIVVSPRSYNEISSYVIVCPVTRSLKPWPFKFFLPENQPVQGAVIIDQVKAVDRSLRVLRYQGRISDSVLADIRSLLASTLGIPVSA